MPRPLTEQERQELKEDDMDKDAHGRYASVNGLNMYYEMYYSTTEAHGAVCDAGGPMVDASGPKRSTYAAWTSCQRSAGVHGASSSLR